MLKISLSLTGPLKLCTVARMKNLRFPGQVSSLRPRYVCAKESLAAFSQPPERMSQALALEAAFLHSGCSAPLREEPSQSLGRSSPTNTEQQRPGRCLLPSEGPKQSRTCFSWRGMGHRHSPLTLRCRSINICREFQLHSIRHQLI